MKTIIEPEDSLIIRIKTDMAAKGITADFMGENFDIAARAMAYSIKNGLGMFLIGNVGTGKSTFFKYMSKFAYGTMPNGIDQMPSRYLSLKDPVTLRHLDVVSGGSFIEDCFNCNIFLDDLGAEYPVNEYGVRREFALDFILAYSEHGKGIISTSTNLNGNGLLDRYTGRIDFLKDLMFRVNFVGETKREWAVTI